MLIKLTNNTTLREGLDKKVSGGYKKFYDICNDIKTKHKKNNLRTLFIQKKYYKTMKTTTTKVD
jgi:hypothetical protein